MVTSKLHTARDTAASSPPPLWDRTRTNERRVDGTIDLGAVLLSFIIFRRRRFPKEYPFNREPYRYILAEADPHAPFRQVRDEFHLLVHGDQVPVNR